MAYDEYTAERIERLLKDRKVDFYAKRMFAGLVFMIDEKMACGVHFDKKKETDLLMARIGDDASRAALTRNGCHPMDFTGRPMKDYVFVTPEGYDSEQDLAYYIDLCVQFNPLAKASKKRPKKD